MQVSLMDLLYRLLLYQQQECVFIHYLHFPSQKKCGTKLELSLTNLWELLVFLETLLLQASLFLDLLVLKHSMFLRAYQLTFFCWCKKIC